MMVQLTNLINMMKINPKNIKELNQKAKDLLNIVISIVCL